MTPQQPSRAYSTSSGAYRYQETGEDPFLEEATAPEQLAEYEPYRGYTESMPYQGDLGVNRHSFDYDQNQYEEHDESSQRLPYYNDNVPLTSPTVPYPTEETYNNGYSEPIGGVQGLPQVEDSRPLRGLGLSGLDDAQSSMYSEHKLGRNDSVVGGGDESAFEVGELRTSDHHDTMTSTEDSDQETQEWLQRQRPSALRRAGTRKVDLVKGQVFTFEYEVPTAVKMSALPEYRDEEAGRTEFSHMRYTAATCDPDDFRFENGYSLRSAEYGRKTELLITVTYYNEDKVLTARTLYGIMQNIRDICNLKRSEFWGQNGQAWQKIMVVLVMDGLDPCDKNVLDMLATVGVYQDAVMKKNVNGEETVAHIFEYTTQLCVTPQQQLVRPEQGNSSSMPPIQMLLCLKQENSKKINSHRWVFNAFCPMLKPEVVVLIDAGTRPGPKSILHLWQSFYNNPTVGGACGEIHAMLGPHKRYLINPLVAAQNFEYKISNILDKPLESMFGYISVLPGAFSAYRYAAVEGRPLEQYFHGDQTLAKRLGKKGVNGMGIFRKNMFLAEDRILCLEVVFKRDCNWHLSYVKASKAETDVPDGVAEFMGQRRRWLNGSFAAGIYAIMHFGRVYHSRHNPLRILFLHLQFCYNILQQILSWFMLGCYYLTITIIIELSANPREFGAETDQKSFPFGVRASSIISIIVKYVYTLFLMVSFILALGNRPRGSKWFYYFMMFVWGVIQIYALIISFYLASNAFSDNMVDSVSEFFSNFFTSTTALVVVALASTFGLYIVSGLIYLDPWHILTSFAQYMFLMPSFVNVLNVYAFCNWHDVSWGTKGSHVADSLPEAKLVKVGEVAVVEEATKSITDIDEEFQQVVKRALAPYKPAKRTDGATDEDKSQMFRTYLVIIWIVSNIVLIWAITSTDTLALGMTDSVRERISRFFAVLLWSNAVVAIVRFIGCLVFVLKSFFVRIFNRR